MQQEYTVAEAVLILVQKGLVSEKSGEQKIRRWIRSYLKEFEKQMNEMKHADSSQEEKEEMAHFYASQKGLKANKISKKQGYIIKAKDLNELIELRMSKKLEKAYGKGSIAQAGYVNKMYSMKEEKLEYYRNHSVAPMDVGAESTYGMGFEDGFQAALKFLEERNLEKYTLPDEAQDKIIEFPKKYRWYHNAEDITINKLDFSEDEDLVNIQQSWIGFSYDFVPGLNCHLRIWKTPYDLKCSFSCFSGVGYALATHNEKYLNSLFSFKLMNQKPEETDIKTVKNVLILLNGIQTKLRDTDNENKLQALLAISSLVDELEGIVGETDGRKI